MSTADQAGRHAGCPRDGLRHDALQGALPEVPSQQPEQERALAVGGAAEQRGKQPAPLGLRALAGDCPDGLERRVSVSQRQGWFSRLAGRSRAWSTTARPEQVRERRIAHPDLALAQFAGQEGHRDGHFTRRHRGEQHRDLLDLGAPRRRAGDRR